MKAELKAGQVIKYKDKLWVVCSLGGDGARIIAFDGEQTRTDGYVLPDATLARNVKPVCVRISQTNYAEKRKDGSIGISHKVPKTLRQAIDWTRNHSHSCFGDFEGSFAVNGIEFYPYDTYGWGEAGYHVQEDGTLKFCGAEWDSSD